MNELNKAIDEAKKIIIAGHVRPDGDCIGACVALQRYIKRFYPEKNVCVYIETVPEVFQFMDDKKDIFSNSVTAARPTDLVMHRKHFIMPKVQCA